MPYVTLSADARRDDRVQKKPMNHQFGVLEFETAGVGWLVVNSQEEILS